MIILTSFKLIKLRNRKCFQYTLLLFFHLLPPLMNIIKSTLPLLKEHWKHSWISIKCNVSELMPTVST